MARSMARSDTAMVRPPREVYPWETRRCYALDTFTNGLGAIEALVIVPAVQNNRPTGGLLLVRETVLKTGG